ncbi:MAG: glycosyltransferase, partial [Planctomycetota bacterium JB042]
VLFRSVVTFSRSAAREAVLDLGADDGKIDVSSLAVDPAMAAPPDDRDAAARRERLGAAGRYLLAVGKDYPHKDLAAAVAALKGLPPDVTLLVAGARVWHRPLADGRTLDETIRRLGVADRVRWIDGASDDDLKALLVGAEALVYPSHEEGFGLPPLEAMTLGVPVVTTGSMSIPEVTGDTVWTHEAGDVRGLEAALGRVLAGGPDVERRVGRARERAGRFTWDACAEGLLASYRAAAEAGARRGDAPPRSAEAMLDMLDVLARHGSRDASEVAHWKARCAAVEREFRALEEKFRDLRADAPRWSLRRRLRKIRRALGGGRDPA